MKHFIGNEQELNRLPNFVNQSASSAQIDDKTMHELYMWPFMDAVEAGAMSVMASYQRINNSFATQNSKALNGLLKTELGFQGYVVSDWGGQHTGVASVSNELVNYTRHTAYLTSTPGRCRPGTVSYTHLTLPTKRIV